MTLSHKEKWSPCFVTKHDIGSTLSVEPFYKLIVNTKVSERQVLYCTRRPSATTNLGHIVDYKLVRSIVKQQYTS